MLQWEVKMKRNGRNYSLMEDRTIRSSWSTTAYPEIARGLHRTAGSVLSRAKKNLPIRTWGGRMYYVEPSRFVAEQGRYMDFSYKMLNYLIQGSSADLSKEAIIAYFKRRVNGQFLLMVHDELVIKVPKEHLKTEMAILKDCMESLALDCPLTSDGEVGQNYHNLDAYND